MNFILPAEGVSLLSCLEKLAEGDWRRAMPLYGQNIEAGESLLDLSIPKFSMQADKSLKAELQSLGMEEAFSSNADFSGISESKLSISDIQQAVSLSVDEDGALAAAATKIIMAGASIGEEPEVIDFSCNRPFIFCITEKSTGCVLFVGKIEKL